MQFELQPDFVAWIEREGARLVLLVKDLTDLEQASRRPPSGRDDERATVTITKKDIIGEIQLSQVDIFGRLTTRFYPAEDKMFGLTDEDLQQALRFIEKIHDRKEVRDILSTHTIQELVLEWIGNVFRKRTSGPLAQEIIKTVRDRVKPLSVGIPIEETSVDGELSFADATLKMVSRRELDAQIDSGFRTAPPEQAQLMKEKLHHEWLGKAAMYFSIEAEPVRAREIALEKAETYMALLQFYGPAPRILPLTSYAAPSGIRPRQRYTAIAFHEQSLVNVSQGLTGITSRLEFNAEFRTFMENAGLLVLSSLASEPACDYEISLLTSLLIYGRACYQLDPVDKLLQIITALENYFSSIPGSFFLLQSAV